MAFISFGTRARACRQSSDTVPQTSAPGTYAIACRLVDLWTTKMCAAEGRAFPAMDDIFGALSDIITAAAFTTSGDYGITKGKHDLLLNFGQSIPLEKKPDGTLEFPSPPLVQWADAMEYIGEFQAKQFQSLFPRLYNKYNLLTRPKLRKAFKIIKDFETDQIDQALERMKDGDERQLSAIDAVVRREKIVAEKENRKPEYYARRAYDEVRATLAAVTKPDSD